MGLRSLFSAARRRWRFVLVTVAVGFLAGMQASNTGLSYTAEATIYVGSRAVDIGEEAEGGQGGTFALTSANLVASRPIIDEMLDRTGVARERDAVLAATRAELVPFTQLLQIAVRDRDPMVAKRMANGIADVYLAKVAELEPVGGRGADEGRLPTSPAYSFERADLPTEPDPRDRGLRIVLGTLVGLGASVVALLLATYLDPAPRSAEEVEGAVGVDVLGAIPRHTGYLPAYGIHPAGRR